MVKDIKKFAEELEKRTKQSAIDIIRLSMTLPNTPEGRTIRNQLTKAGTSVGANYREANRSRSKKDFRNKIAICENEASETQYWLEMISESNFVSLKNIKPIFNECSELLAIFSSIGKGIEL